jgi:predicted Zn finger-like uncharacterized protein
MIISCNSCYKKFEISSDLIPEKGRLLECSICNNQWFFKKDKPEQEIKPINKVNSNDVVISEIKIKSDLKNTNDEKNFKEVRKSHSKRKSKKIGILNFILIFIISITALIILIDTFTSPISFFIPNIEFILYNLYESIKDIILFFKDLL